MRVLTWNMGFWQFRSHHEMAWEYLRSDLKPAIALLQEVKPAHLLLDEHLVFKEIHQGWGTAVYARAIDLREVHFRQYPGRIAGAIAVVDGIGELYVASIHAPIINSRVFPHLDHIIDEVEDLFAGRTAVVGGDLNSARLAEVVWPAHGHGPFFERMEGGPFVDCCRRFHKSEIQTYFGPNSAHPFQDDHLFVSPDLAEKLTSCDAVLTDVTKKVSDHIPLAMDLRIGS